MFIKTYSHKRIKFILLIKLEIKMKNETIRLFFYRANNSFEFVRMFSHFSRQNKYAICVKIRDQKIKPFRSFKDRIDFEKNVHGSSIHDASYTTQNHANRMSYELHNSFFITRFGERQIPFSSFSSFLSILYIIYYIFVLYPIFFLRSKLMDRRKTYIYT